MKTILFSAIIGLLILMSYSCQKEMDTKNPSVTLENFSVQAIKSVICLDREELAFKVGSGDQFSFRANFSDDKALTKFKIDLHHNFNCHSHITGVIPGVSLISPNAKTVSWVEMTIGNISGSTEAKVINLKVPDNVTAGNYHLSVTAIDESGNEGEIQDIQNIIVTNKEDMVSPLLNVESPGSRSINAKKGDNIKFCGIVTDNHSLNKGGNGLVFLSYTNLSTGYIYATETFKYFSGAEEKISKFELNHTIAATLAAGEYKFTLVAFDGVRNISIPIHFAVKIQ